MEKQDYIQYWIRTSTEDMISMEHMFSAGSYDWSLFIGHLALEKILKALWVKNNTSDIPPKTHNLKKIADEANYTLTENESILMLEINDFNLEARYPDYKFDFKKKCTKDFTANYISKIRELHRCIVNQI